MHGQTEYDAFCKALKELREAMPTLNADELDNGWKCASLLYLQLDAHPVLMSMAASRLQYVGKEVIECEVQLMKLEAQ